MDLIDLLEEGLAQMELAKRLTVVSVTLLVYDWASNLHLETAYIWGAPWTYGRFLYHLNRICPLIFLGISLPVFLFHSSPHQSVVHLYAYGCSISTDIITGVLVLRCWALYSSRRVLWILGIGLVCTATSTIMIASQIMKQTLFLPPMFRGVLTGCTVIPPTSMWVGIIPTTVFESTVFALTLWKLGTMKRRYGSTPLSRRLAEHGIVYFAVRVALIIFACIGSSVKTFQIATNASGILIAISSVVCSRIIFSLYQLDEERRAGLSTLNLTSNCSPCSMPEFAVPMTSIPCSPLSKHPRESLAP